VSPADPTLALPTPPALAEPVGSLDHPLRRDLEVDRHGPFAVAGRRACVTGVVARGADQVRVHPHRMADGPRLVDAFCDAAAMTPLGLERRLRVAGGIVIERVVVARDAPFALFEWEIEDEAGGNDRGQEHAVAAELEWAVEADDDASTGPFRWQTGPRLLATAGARGLAAFVFSVEPDSLAAHGPGEGDGGVDGEGPARLRVRARVTLRPGHGLRLAMASAADDATLERALRAANRTRAVVQARRGFVARLLEDRLSLESPDLLLDRAVAEAKVALADRVVDRPGIGRTLAAGYGADGPTYLGAAMLQGARDALLTGDFDAARDVLLFLGRHQGPGGGGEPGATVPYLALAGEYHAWTGDTASMGAEWPRLMAAWDRVGELPEQAVVDGLVHVAEALGERATVTGARGQGRSGVVGSGGRGEGQGQGRGLGVEPGLGQGLGRGLGMAPTGLGRLRRLLGVEPDAVRGRLTLRPRPPAEWEHFQVQGLAMGDAAFSLAYRRTGSLHRHTVRQDRGPVPATLILELEIPGPLRAARVDGVSAQLAAVEGAHRGAWRVPVQLTLDHERVVELEVGTGS
jgi:hypothetical protein